MKDAKANPIDAAIPLSSSELDELERRLATDDPELREHTRVWTLVAIRQLRTVLASQPLLHHLEVAFLMPIERFIRRSRVRPTDGQIDFMLNKLNELRARLRALR